MNGCLFRMKARWIFRIIFQRSHALKQAADLKRQPPYDGQSKWQFKLQSHFTLAKPVAPEKSCWLC
ncbi:MAG: hypothetical protein COA78_27040 [Blastopirellula sp.]|nr:MAG: hypothetical protein COA78_27040 [Blastopirellula sp.]